MAEAYPPRKLRGELHGHSESDNDHDNTENTDIENVTILHQLHLGAQTSAPAGITPCPIPRSANTDQDKKT